LPACPVSGRPVECSIFSTGKRANRLTVKRTKAMFDKLEGVENRFSEVEQMLGDPNVLKDRVHFRS
jgi:hypothetical protein